MWDGIALEPGLMLGGVAVPGHVADEVAPVAPGLRLDEGGAPTAARPLDGFRRHLPHGEHVVTVDHHSRKAVGGGAVGHVFELHVISLRVRHAVVVVLADVDGR